MGDKPKVISISSRTSTQQPASKSTIDVTASFSARQPALTEPELQVQVVRIVRFGTYWRTRHAERDRAYRNISDDDIQTMLMGSWRLKGKPEWSDERRNWKYTLTGTDAEGDELTLVVALNTEEQTITIITNF